MIPEDFDYLRKLLRERSGLVLAAEKQYLAESRLLPVARKHRLSSLADLVERLKTTSPGVLATEVIEAMTTNETLFFRDKIPYNQFRDIIVPALIASHSYRRSIRIWCAAAASGQEPYSLAMILREMNQLLAGFKIEILATDLSNEMLEKAKTGIYSQFGVQRGLPIQQLIKYFARVGEFWQIAPELRAMVSFRQLNLLQDFGHLGSFDLIFCRNVLIYFDQPTKKAVLERLSRLIEPDGFLVLGAAETVIGLTDTFKPMVNQRGLYVPQRKPTAQSERSNVLKFVAKA